MGVMLRRSPLRTVATGIPSHFGRSHTSPGRLGTGTNGRTEGRGDGGVAGPVGRRGRVERAGAGGCLALLVAGCGSTTQGRAVSPLYDPFRAGGLPAQDGPSGIREDAPAP